MTSTRDTRKSRTIAPADDPFLTRLYDSLHDTPMQRKYKRIRPMPVGVVFLQWPDMGWDEMRQHLRLMKKLGYNCLKGIGLLEGFDQKRYMHMALDEGIIPWWYGEAGWEPVTDELLDRLGLPPNTPIEHLRADERFLKHQEEVLRRRIDAPPVKLRALPQDVDETDSRWQFNVGKELSSRTARLPEQAIPMFVEWLQRKYGTIEKLRQEWNCGHVGINHAGGIASWEDVRRDVIEGGPKNHDYNRYKDVIRFKTEVFLAQVRQRLDVQLEHDPDEPLRAGGEMSVFLPLVGRGIDMEGFGRIMADRGSLYPSTHLAWHFDNVNYEVARTIYMYSSIVVDCFKGGWSATWESTGGPQQVSGDKGWSAFAKQHMPAYTVDAGVMTQMMLSYLAAGYRGFGFWCWTYRTAGREGGEYSLLDRNGRPGRRAVAVGKIAAAAVRLRDELWLARKEPTVGVLIDQENDIQWSVMEDYGREIQSVQPVLARVGVSRALINANVPWEYVTADNLRRGLADRYRVIYLPAMLAVSSDVMEILHGYAHRGGRVVMDMPGWYFDERARIPRTDAGTLFERLFGCTIDDYQYSSNVPRSIHGQALTGYVLDMTPTRATILDTYDTGAPAVTENACGKGSAVILGYEASLMCARPGNAAVERMLVRRMLGKRRSPYACDGAIVYRLAAPQADHYFFINDGPARTVVLDTGRLRYSAVTDPVTGQKLPLGAPVQIERYGGRWLRYEK